MPAWMDNSFWALVALVVLIGVFIWQRVPGMVAKMLDERAEKIAAELEEARRLREEAQTMLASYQRKQREAQAEADDIVEAAKAEAERLVEDTRAELAEQLKRRARLAEDKIAQAEAQAMNEVRAVAADAAVAAARKIISEQIDAGKDASLIDQSINDLSGKLN